MDAETGDTMAQVRLVLKVSLSHHHASRFNTGKEWTPFCDATVQYVFLENKDPIVPDVKSYFLCLQKPKLTFEITSGSMLDFDEENLGFSLDGLDFRAPNFGVFKRMRSKLRDCVADLAFHEAIGEPLELENLDRALIKAKEIGISPLNCHFMRAKMLRQALWEVQRLCDSHDCLARKHQELPSERHALEGLAKLKRIVDEESLLGERVPEELRDTLERAADALRALEEAEEPRGGIVTDAWSALKGLAPSVATLETAAVAANVVFIAVASACMTLPNAIDGIALSA